MNKATDIATIALAVIGLLGVIVAVIAWFYRRGGHERSLSDALKENTKSNHEVAAELRDFKAETLKQLVEHDKQLRDHTWRLRFLEHGKEIDHEGEAAE